MKAWDDLVKSKEMSIYTTRDSEYYIDYGVKIERFDDGRIEVKNTMTRGDMFEDVDENILTFFNEDGWIRWMYASKHSRYTNDKLLKTQ